MTAKIFKKIKLTDKIESFFEKNNFDYSESSEDAIIVDNSNKSHVNFVKVDQLASSLPIAHINESILDYPFGERLLESFFKQHYGLSPEYFFHGVLIKNSSLKVLDSASYGLYCDYICSEASDLNHSSRQIRRFITDFFMLMDRFSYGNEIHLPLNVDYGKGKDTFYAQFSCKISSSFRYDFFIKNVSDLLMKTHALELCLSPDKTSLVVRSFWFRDFKKESWPSLSIIKDSFYRDDENFPEGSLVETTYGPSINEKVIKSGIVPDEETVKKKQWRFMREVLVSLVNLKKTYELNNKDFPESFSLKLLVHFAKEAQTFDKYDLLTNEEKEVLLGCMNNAGPQEEFQRLFHEEMIDIDPRDLMNRVEKKVEGSDFSKVAKENDFTRVKGAGFEKEKIQIVKGEKEESDNSIWEIKKQEVVSSLKCEYSKLKDPLPFKIEKVLTDTLKKELSLDDQKLEGFVSDIVDSISEDLLPDLVPSSQFINKTMGTLKKSTMKTNDENIKVPTLDLKLVLSFTDKLMRKANNYERTLKKESDDKIRLMKEEKYKNAVMENTEILNEVKKNKDLKAKILNLERSLEISMQGEKPQKVREGGLQDDLQKIIDDLNEDVKSAKANALDYKRRLKLNENESVKLKTQLARFMKKSSGEELGAGNDDLHGGPVAKVKHLEKLNAQYLESSQKMEKEMSIKKKELHGARLEAKTLANKLKAAEKKLEVMNRRKAS